MVELRYECIVPQDGSSFRCIHERVEDLSADHPWHFHPEFELSWLIRSRGTRFVGDYIERYEPGEVVLYGPNLPHCSRNDVGGREGTAEHITVQFDIFRFGAGLLEIAEADAIRALLEEARSALLFAPEAAKVVGPLLRDILTLSGMARLLKLLEILDALSRLSRRELITAGYHHKVVIDQQLIQRLNRVQRYVDQRFRGLVSQAEIAEDLGMSAATFSRFIRAATGRTFISIVKITRISEACRQLTFGANSITDIALDCGYQHTSQLDRHFMELKGMSPSEYRRRARARAARASDNTAA